MVEEEVEEEKRSRHGTWYIAIDRLLSHITSFLFGDIESILIYELSELNVDGDYNDSRAGPVWPPLQTLFPYMYMYTDMGYT